GRDFTSFLASLEDVPGQIQLALPDFYLPPLKVLEPSPGRFELHCGAGLWGLGSIATGLLRAVAQDYQTAAQVELQNTGAQAEVVCITVPQTARANSVKQAGEAAPHG
ncbi:MAG: heme NO-binding protein, partial [Planktomarina sp.]